MSTVISELSAVINADVTGFRKGMDQAKSALGALAGAIGGISFAGIFTKALDEAKEAELGMKQLDAVLRSTKGAAGVTKEAALDLASSLSKVTTYSDDAVLSAENMMLTFTKVGGKVFDDAIEASLDLSVAMGSDLKSSVLQVGKALNNLDYNALIRNGVSFTEAQKRQIDTLKRAGKTVEAQRLILSELKNEFQGSAKAAGSTFAGAMAQAQNAINDVFEALGTALLPSLTGLLHGFTGLLDGLGPVAPALLGVAAAIGAVTLVASPLGAAIAVLVSPIGLVIGAVAALALAFNSNFLGIRDKVNALVSGIKPTLETLKNTLQNIFSPGKATANDLFSSGQFDPTKQIADQLSKMDSETFSRPLADKIRAAIPAIQQAFSYMLSTVGSWLGGQFYTLSAGLNTLLGQIGDWLSSNGPTKVLDGFAGIIAGAARWFMTDAWPILQNGVSDLLSAVRDFFSGDGVSRFKDGLGSAISQVATWIGTQASNLLGGFATLLNGVSDWLSGDGKTGLQSGFSNILTQIGTWISTNGVPLVKTGFETVVNALINFVQQDGVQRFIGAWVTFIGKAGEWFSTNAWNLLSSGVSALFDSIKGWIITNGPQKFIDGVNTMVSAAITWLINTGPTLLQQGISSFVKGAGDWLGGEGGTQFTTGITNAINSAVSWMKNDGVSLFVSGGKAMIDGIVAVFSGIAQAIVDAVVGGINRAVAIAKGMVGLGGGDTAASTASGGKSAAEPTTMAPKPSYTGNINRFGVPTGTPAGAIGGPTIAGRPMLVGERGPELFTPTSSGSITPNGKMGGNVTIVQNITTTDPEIIMNRLNGALRRRNAALLGG